MPLTNQNIRALSAGTSSVSNGTVVFSNSNGVSFGLSGSTITGSVAAGVAAGSISAGATNVGLGQAVFSNDNNVSFGLTGSTITATASFSAQTEYLFSNSNGISFGTNASTVTVSYTVPSVTEYQFISNSSLSLGTGATASLRHTSADTQLRFTSADSQLRFTSADSQLRFTSADSQLRFTSADSQLQFTSANSNFRFTSADSQLQFTSANTKFVQNWQLTGNTAGTTSSAQGSDLWLAGGNGITISGSSNTLSFLVATNYQSQGAYLTTADLSQNSSKYIQNWKLSGNTAGTTSSAQGTDLWLAGGNGVTISGSSNTLSFSVATNYQSQGAYLTTADLSANSSKYIQEWEFAGAQTAGTTSSAQGTRLYLSGGNMMTLSGSSNTIVLSMNSASLLGTGATASFRHTSADSQLQFTSANSNFRFSSADSQLRFTSADSQLRFTSADSQLQFTSANTKFVQEWQLVGAQTAGTTSSAQGSQLYLSGGNMMTLSGSSNTIVVSMNSASLLGTAATQSFRFTSANSQLQFTSANSNFVQATAAFAGTNASGTIASGGISVSVAAPGAGGGIALANSEATYTSGTANILEGGGAITIASTTGQKFNFSVPQTSSISATGIVSISVNASTISIGASQSAQTVGLYASSNTYLTSSGTVDARSLSFRGDKSITVGISSGEVLFSVGAYLTTARGSTDAIGLNTALTANGAAWTVNSSGISLSIPAFLTTARGSTDAIGLNTAQTNVTWTANSSGLSLNAGGYAGTNTATTGGISVTLNTSGISLNVGAYLTTAELSANSSKYAISWELEGNNTAGTTGSSQGTIWYFSGGNNITLSGNSNTIVISAPAATTYSNFFEPFDIFDATATTTGSLSQLNLQPFSIHNNLSFGNINIIGIAAVVPTSASQSWSARLTNSTQGLSYKASYSITNGNLVDLYLFSRGSGKFSSELETFASTRNSFLTYYNVTFGANATLTNTAGGSIKGSQTISMSISYPFMTSGQVIVGASTDTTWGSGYTTWTSTASNSSEFTISTSAARTLSIASTYPATVGWSGAKIVNFNFGSSLSPGEYWLGGVRYSTTSSSSSSADSFTGAAGTGNSYSVTYNASGLTQTAELTWMGKTNTIINSLGSLGFVTTANVAPQFGEGSFSGTWASNTTYNNNAGNPAGAVAFTQLRTQVSFFNTWLQFASNRI